jgi:predicted nucleic acid-binding protein
VIYFLDTSVLVKRYVTEKGSDQVRRLLRRDVEIAVARITEAKAYAAIARAVRAARSTRMRDTTAACFCKMADAVTD